MKKIFAPILGVLSFGAAAFAFADLTLEKGAKSKPVYIIKLQKDSVLEYQGGIAGIAATKPADGEKVDVNSESVKKFIDVTEALHDDILNSVGASASSKIYSYKYAANGFAAKLTPEQVDQLKARKDLLVMEDEILQPQSNNTPTFLGLTQKGRAWARGWTGENVVVGIIDTGINPEHPSFADVKTPIRGARGPKRPYGPVPEEFKGTECVFGNAEFNANDAPFECNNKLIKANYFVEGWGVENLIESEFLSARDSNGHGSHTAGTAAGNFGVAADLNGDYEGDISGIAPRARVAAYKVCWQGNADRDNDGDLDSGCPSSDSMAAIDQAIADGVDVLNFSIGGSSTLFSGPDDIAFLRAADAGIFVATSQGNSGPGPGTTGTPAGVPWITSVGASQDSSVMATGVDVAAPASLSGRYIALEGGGPVSLEDVGDISADVVTAIPQDACSELNNPAELEGKIALVIRGGCGFIAKYTAAQNAGARAIVVYNDGTASDRINPIVMGGLNETVTIPGVMVTFTAGDAMVAALRAEEAVTAMVGPSIQIPQTDRIANFSSRGPNNGALDLIKPDIAAPGVSILAAGSAQPNEATSSANFISISGTSMASPHIAGVFALLKQAHPTWSAAMAKSAVMTSARRYGLKKTFGEEAADPFDVGAGIVDPNKAFKPGLVYDAGLNDYQAFSCANNVALVGEQRCEELREAGYSTDGSDLNLPSIGVGELIGRQVVKRTITSVTKGRRWFELDPQEPLGIDMNVWPKRVRLSEGESADFFVEFSANSDAVFDEWAFGAVDWFSRNGKLRVHSPIAIRPVALVADETLSSTDTDGTASIAVQFGFSGEFAATVDGLVAGAMISGAVEDGGIDQNSGFTVPEGATLARFAIYDAEVGDGAGTDDLDIQVYGPDTAGFPLAGSSETASSTEIVDIENPAPGLYIVVVFDYASAEGLTDFSVYNYTLDGSTSEGVSISAPASVAVSESHSVDVSWSDLLPATRYMGVVSYSNENGPLAPKTEININTQ